MSQQLPGLQVPLKNRDSTPIMIEVGFNPHMGRWDVLMTLGNFRTEEEARRAGEVLKRLAERDLGSEAIKGH